MAFAPGERAPHRHHLDTAAVKEQVADLLGELLEGAIEGEVVTIGEGHQPRLEEAGVAPRPRGDRPRAQAQGRIRHHPLGVDLEEETKPRAARTRPLRGVEGEGARGELGERHPAGEAGETLGEGAVFTPGEVVDHHHPLAQLEGGLHRVGDPTARRRFHHQPVDHHLDGVAPLAIEHRQLAIHQLHHGPVHPRAHIPLADHRLELRPVLPLAVAH